MLAVASGLGIFKGTKLNTAQGSGRSGGYLHCYVHIEKCGGTTHIDFLRRNFGLRHVDVIPLDRQAEIATKADVEKALARYPQAFSLAGHSLRPYGDFGIFRERMKFYTLLRNPIQRYASDYLNDCRSRGFLGTLSDWTRFESQHNLQVRSLSKRGSVTEAKEVLERDMAFFDVVENYEQFLAKLRYAMAPLRISPKYVIKNAADRKLGSRAGRTEHILSDQELERVSLVNKNDLELYEWATGFLQKQGRVPHAGSLAFMEQNLDFLVQASNLLKNKLVRNLVYKPDCGLWPGQIDVLPRYKMNAQSYNLLATRNTIKN
jgi:Sulfotransferase family